MGTLSEFLSSQADRARSETHDREALVQEWCEAVTKFLSQMKSWLSEADPQGLLRIEPTVHEITEVRLGSYTAPGMRIWLGTRCITVEPIARYPVGSTADDPLGASLRGGRIDLKRRGQRYMLYRKSGTDDPQKWVIVDDFRYTERPFERESFEAAIKSLFE